MLFCVIFTACKSNKNLGKSGGFFLFFVTLHPNYKFMQEIKTFTDYKLSLRDRILDTAMKDFARRGVKAVKMDDIAAALAISKRTLYEIYDTKEQVIFEGLKRYHRLKSEELAAYASAPHHDVLDIIIFIYRRRINDSSALNPAFYDEISKYPQIVEYLESQKQRRQQDFIQFMQRGVDEGFFRNEINYTIISHVFEALGSYMQQTRLYYKYSFKELFFNMLFVTLRGFCTAKGISKLDQFFAANRP